LQSPTYAHNPNFPAFPPPNKERPFVPNKPFTDIPREFIPFQPSTVAGLPKSNEGKSFLLSNNKDNHEKESKQPFQKKTFMIF
jgi:hypothetical protein